MRADDHEAPSAASPGEPAPGAATPSHWGLALAVALFALGTASVYGEVLVGDLRESAPRLRPERSPAGESTMELLDQRFTTWLIARNAHAILHQPLALFDARTCYPEPDALALGHAALATGLLAVPAYLASGDPVATYNVVLMAFAFVSALAMFLVVRDWTGSAPAALFAGAFYGFHELRLAYPAYPFHTDTLWMLLALFFGRRWLLGGGWAAALATTACICLQIAESFYSLVGGGIVTGLALLALAWSHGTSLLSARRVAVAGLCVAATAALVLWPYLGKEWYGSLEAREAYLAWGHIGPGSVLFPGWLTLGLAFAGVAIAARGSAGCVPAPVRAALALAAGVTLLLATGGNAGEAEPALRLPNPFHWLGAVMPGARLARAPSLLASGVHLALALLSGIGAAALLARIPSSRGRAAAGTALVLTAAAGLLEPSLPGRSRFEMHALRPPGELLADFERLAREGNAGPVLELPLFKRSMRRALESTERVLAAAYHQRRTTACYNSIGPALAGELQALEAALPRREALDGLAALGVTTLVVHRPRDGAVARRLSRRLDAASDSGAGVHKLLDGRAISAYAVDAGS